MAAPTGQKGSPQGSLQDMDVSGHGLLYETRGVFLCDISLEKISVSAHHEPNESFCLFLAILLQQLRNELWLWMPTNVGRDKKDMESLKWVLLPEFQEVRAKLNNAFWDRSSEEGRIAIRMPVLRRRAVGVLCT